MESRLFKTEEEAIADCEKQVDENDFYVEFGGMNCESYLGNSCMGWDGSSRRCDCGNRRVYWETGRNSEGLFYAYAQAY